MNRLLFQFSESPKLKALLEVVLNQLKQTESAFEEIRELKSLDVLGKIVGQERSGMNDDDYALWIKARVLLNRSRGTPEDLLQILNILLGDGSEIREHPEAAFTVLLQKMIHHDPAKIWEIIREAAPLGVKAHLQVALKEPVFRFDMPEYVNGYWSEQIA